MTGNPNGLGVLMKASSLPADRIKYLPSADAAIIGDIDCGILFVMAFWSAPAFASFSKLTNLLRRHDPQAALDLTVVDADGSPQLYSVAGLKGQFHGNGETLWISGGKIVAQVGNLAAAPEAVIGENIPALVAKCSGQAETGTVM